MPWRAVKGGFYFKGIVSKMELSGYAVVCHTPSNTADFPSGQDKKINISGIASYKQLL